MPTRFLWTVRCVLAALTLAANDIAAQDVADPVTSPGRSADTNSLVVPPRGGADAGRARERLVVPASVFTMTTEGAKSRSRGARRGLLIGAVSGAVLGFLVTNDFMDEPMVNAAAG